jgi:hypothetical protein
MEKALFNINAEHYYYYYYYHRKTVGQLIFRCKAIQFYRMDFEVSALIVTNLADLKSLVSVGEVPPDPTESRRKKSPVSRKRVKVRLIFFTAYSTYMNQYEVQKIVCLFIVYFFTI